MFANSVFNLSAYGRVYDIKQVKNKLHLSILLTGEFNEFLQDEVMVECEVDRNQFCMMTSISREFAKDKTIYVKFEAAYLGLKNCFSGMTPEDPVFCVHLIANLLDINEYFIEPDCLSYRNFLTIKDDKYTNLLSA